MALKWNTIRAEHVTQACELVVGERGVTRGTAKGIFVVFRDHTLPAKHVLRLAYLLANGLAVDTPLKFSSGEGTVSRLQGLGFKVVRNSSQG
jgi:hypothetical protein